MFTYKAKIDKDDFESCMDFYSLTECCFVSSMIHDNLMFVFFPSQDGELAMYHKALTVRIYRS